MTRNLNMILHLVSYFESQIHSDLRSVRMYFPTSTILALFILTSTLAMLITKDEVIFNSTTSPPWKSYPPSMIGDGILDHFSRILPKTTNSILATDLEHSSHTSPSPGWSAHSWTTALTQMTATDLPTPLFDGYSACAQFVGHTPHCIFPFHTAPWNNGTNVSQSVTRTKSETQTLTGMNTHSTILPSSSHSSSTPDVSTGPKRSDAKESIRMLAWQVPVMLFLGLFAAVNLVWSGIFGDVVEGEEEDDE
ncbi:hypothetical protein BGZ60DRAFT_539305 [Tricladium varicosporioides]|nr:hypothetical protein BGZ60DRAFT_539305 [Hymenoscyphus varicosporioides]